MCSVASSAFDIGLGEADPLFDKALDIVIAAHPGLHLLRPALSRSCSRSDRRKLPAASSELKIGYNRAARLAEELEIRGIVGPANGSKAREVIRVPSKARE